MTDKVLTNEEIVESLKQKTLLDISELVEMIENTFGVSAAPVAVAAAAGAGAAPAQEEEKTEFTVILKEFGKEKIKVIKEVRAITNLGLKEAKELVESVPKEVVKDVSKEESDEVKKKLEAAGAVVEIK